MPIILQRFSNFQTFIGLIWAFSTLWKSVSYSSGCDNINLFLNNFTWSLNFIHILSSSSSRHYIPGWVLASETNIFYWLWSRAIRLESYVHPFLIQTSSICAFLKFTVLIPFFIQRRPVTGMSTARTPGTARGGTSRLGRTPATARAALATAHARAVRLGTASEEDRGPPLVDLTRLEVPKYARDSKVAKTLFEYLFFHEGDYRNVSRSLQWRILCMHRTWRAYYFWNSWV